MERRLRQRSITQRSHSRLSQATTASTFRVTPTAIGCDLAAKQAERKGFFIVSIDGSPDVVPFLKDPKSLIAGDIIPEVVEPPGTVIAVNVGGAVIPGLLSLYLLATFHAEPRQTWRNWPGRPMRSHSRPGNAITRSAASTISLLRFGPVQNVE